MDNYEERSRRGHKYYSINRNSRLQENELKELKEIGGKKVLKILLANSSNPLMDIESLILIEEPYILIVLKRRKHFWIYIMAIYNNSNITKV